MSNYFLEMDKEEEMSKKVKSKLNWKVPSINPLGQLEITSIGPAPPMPGWDLYVAGCPCEMCKQQESNMQVAVNTQEDTAREHLMSRLQRIHWTLDTKLEEKFHLTRKRPEDVKQAKKWLEDGYYIFTAKSDSENACTYWQDFFRWGTEEPDTKGYKAAIELLKTARQNAEDIIMVKTDEDARLKALKDFEAFTVN